MDQKIYYASLMFCFFFYPEVDVIEIDHVRRRSIANVIENGRSIRKAPIMEYESFFTENLQLTGVDFSISDNVTFWKLQCLPFSAWCPPKGHKYCRFI